MRDAEELFWFRQYITRNPTEAHVPPGEFHYAAAAWLDEFATRPT